MPELRFAPLVAFIAFVLLTMPIMFTWRAWRQEKLNQALIVAIKANNAGAVTADIHAGADPNSREMSQTLSSLWERLCARVMHRHEADLPGKTALDLVQSTRAEAIHRQIHLGGVGMPVHVYERQADAAATIMDLLTRTGATE